MIHLCTCTGGSPSSLENPSHREGPEACKSCGGKLIVDGREALPGNMLSTVKLELSKIIDPRLNWKTVTKGRQRTVRRARTSFTGENEKYSITKTLNWSENCTDQESNRMGDIPVSESEKLGVSILGRRFSDALGSVPIKKRRFLLVRSPSPPPHSSHSNVSNNNSEGHSASYGENVLYGKHHQERIVASETTNLNDINEEICDGEDFSGISILAAAACDSGTAGDSQITNTDLESKVQSFQEEKFLGTVQNTESDSLSYRKEEQLFHSSEEFSCKSVLPLERSSITVLPANRLDGNQMDGSNCPNYTNSLQDGSKKTRTVECTSRDSRFHWDLNAVWECNGDEEVANAEPCAVGVVGEDGGHDNTIEKFETCQDSVEHSDKNDAPDPADVVVCQAKDSCELHDTKAHEECDMFVDDSIAGQTNEKEDQPPACGNILARKALQFEDASALRDSTDEMKVFHNQPKGGCESEIDSSLFGDASGPVTEPCPLSSAMKKVKFDACSGSRMESEHLSDQTTNKQVFMESTNPAIINVSNKRSAASDINGVQMEQAMQPINHKVEKNLHNDSGNEDGDHCRSVGLLVGNASDGNICMQTIAVGDSEPVHSDGLTETEEANIDKSKEADIFSCLSDSRPYNSHASCNHDGSSSGSTDDRKPETTSEDMKGDYYKDTVVISSGNTNDAKSDAPGKVPLDDRLDCGFYSNASQLDIDQADEMEKVDLEDNDSQYEDGELREYVQNSWGEEGFEEEEPEQVDYGSDNRESDFFEVAYDIPTVSLPETVPKKNGGCSLGASNDGAVQKDSHSAGLQAELKCSSVSNLLDVGSGRSGMGSSSEKDNSRNLRVKDECRKSERSAKKMLESFAGNNGFPNGSGGTREILEGSRLKSSGWDRLPEGCRTSRHGSRDARLDSGKQIGAATSLDAEVSDDSFRKMGSSARRELSSRIEWPKSSDGPRKAEKSYVESNRSDDSLSLKGERELSSRISTGRGGSSRHTQGQGRGEHWVELPTHSDPTQHESPSYYGPPTFSHPVSRNATAAAVAKVESNGFVVAPDGTIVKAGGVGTAGRVPRRSANASLHSTRRPLSGRGSPTERDGACGMHGGLRRAREMSPDWHFGVGRSRSGQYGTEITRDHYRRPISDDGMDPSLLVRHSLTRRERSFSPCRGLHLSRSHTRSRSRSRTRSPHLWASPSKSDIRMRRGSSFRRRSRSPPNLKSEGRTGRAASPQRRSGFENRMVGYGPSLRNRTSPHSSRWVEERKDSLDHLWEHDYKHFSERSPPSRTFSQSDRFDLMDSSGRLKHDDYYRPIHSSRFPGYVGLGSGSRHDRNGDDRRDHGDRYGLLHSMRHYDTNDNDNSDHFRARDSGVKSSKFQARGSPRVFDRSVDSQLGDSSHRAKEEKDHFRYGKSGKHNTT